MRTADVHNMESLLNYHRHDYLDVAAGSYQNNLDAISTHFLKQTLSVDQPLPHLRSRKFIIQCGHMIQTRLHLETCDLLCGLKGRKAQKPNQEGFCKYRLYRYNLRRRLL
jgi:hypothetical protein